MNNPFASGLLARLPASPRKIALLRASRIGDFICATPALRGYLFNDQGRLRAHVAVFVDGRLIRDRRTLSDTLNATSRVYVAQALSGG